ncbi:MAG: response regulator [Bacteroidetes bacterium]|nr:response regulator [Bacteroidota bacterium]
MKLNCIIVDDEPLAQDVIESYLESEQDIQLLRKCQNALEAREALKSLQVDLLFLDIQMPEISGIDFLRSLESPPMVIFTTAHPNYAVEGFNLDAVDYLMKPISKERFTKAVKKARELYQLKNQPVTTGLPAEDDDHFFVKADQKLVKLRYDDVHYVEALADYVKIHTDEKRIITLQTMKKMEERLPSDRFIRVHRSFIVRIGKIKAISGNKIELGDQQIPIGKNYKSSLYEYLYANNILN